MCADTSLARNPLHLGGEEEEEEEGGTCDTLFSPVKEGRSGEGDTGRDMMVERGSERGEGGGDSDEEVGSGYEDLPMTQEIDPRPLAGESLFV